MPQHSILAVSFELWLSRVSRPKVKLMSLIKHAASDSEYGHMLRLRDETHVWVVKKRLCIPHFVFAASINLGRAVHSLSAYKCAYWRLKFRSFTMNREDLSSTSLSTRSYVSDVGSPLSDINWPTLLGSGFAVYIIVLLLWLTAALCGKKAGAPEAECCTQRFSSRAIYELSCVEVKIEGYCSDLPYNFCCHWQQPWYPMPAHTQRSTDKNTTASTQAHECTCPC